MEIGFGKAECRSFGIAAIAITCSIVAHGLTDTVGARWLARRVGLDRST